MRRHWSMGTSRTRPIGSLDGGLDGAAVPDVRSAGTLLPEPKYISSGGLPTKRRMGQHAVVLVDVEGDQSTNSRNSVQGCKEQPLMFEAAPPRFDRSRVARRTGEGCREFGRGERHRTGCVKLNPMARCTASMRQQRELLDVSSEAKDFLSEFRARDTEIRRDGDIPRAANQISQSVVIASL